MHFLRDDKCFKCVTCVGDTCTSNAPSVRSVGAKYSGPQKCKVETSELDFPTKDDAL